jgi:hypothetical protein
VSGMCRLAAGFVIKSRRNRAPATACDGPGVWPHLRERYDVSNANAHPAGGVA